MSAGQRDRDLQGGRPPRGVRRQFALADLQGTHALGHTRMATESRVTTEGSHPFSTGLDLCLVHNGSLSNHNRLRRALRREGIEFQTENDTEVAAGYLAWRLREGATLEQALEGCLDDLDGFYTFPSERPTASPCSATRSPASPPCSPRRTTGSRWRRSTERSRFSPGQTTRACGSRSPGVVYVWEQRWPYDGGRCRASRSSTSPSTPLRELNQRLHDVARDRPGPARWRDRQSAMGRTPSPAGSTPTLDVEIDGHVGYYCAGMNKRATVRVRGNAGTGVAENMMSGSRRRRGEREPVGRRDGSRRAARRARRRRCAVRHLDEGRRHRRARLGRPHERVHGSERPPRRVR